MKNTIKRKNYGIFGLLPVVLMLGGCASTEQARDVKSSGFLGDYSMLQEGEKGQARRLYINPTYEKACKTYDKVLIEPVTLWTRENKDLADLPAEDRQILVNYLHGALVSELGKYYQIVQAPEPGTLRIRAAITEAEGSWAVPDTSSSFMPQMLVMSKPRELATGTAEFISKASAEVDITDAMTGERIAAAVDRRIEQQTHAGNTRQWGGMNKSFDFWARRMAYRLANCGAMPPEQE